MSKSRDKQIDTSMGSDAREVAYQLRSRRVEKQSLGTKKRPREKSSDGILAMRCDTRQTIPDKDGQLVPVKTSAIFPATIKPNLEAIKLHRPLSISRLSDNHSPLAGQTPGGSTLVRTASLGSLHFFSNTKASPVESGLKKSKSRVSRSLMDRLDTITSVKSIDTDIKSQTYTITRASLTAAIKKHHRNQAAIMKHASRNVKHASASFYAAQAGLNEQVKYEWLHLIAYGIAGEETQIDSNLVTGTKAANTNMIFVERLVDKIAQAYPDGFTIKVTAELMKGTHIANTITYELITPDFTQSFTFDAHAENTPHIEYKRYVEALLDAQLLLAKEEKTKVIIHTP